MFSHRISTHVKSRRKHLLVLVYVASSLIWGPAAEASFRLERADGSRPGNGITISGMVTAPREPLGASVGSFLPKPRHEHRHEPVAPSAASGAGVWDRLAAAWPGDDNWLRSTVSCESGFNPRAVGGGGGNYRGLFQMGPWARSVYGDPLGQSIEQQAAAAWRLLNDEGSSQWSCSPYRYHP